MNIYKALADPIKRKIIENLHSKGSQSIKQLNQNFLIRRQALTKHLNILLKAKLINATFIGKEKYHNLSNKALSPLAYYLKPFNTEWDIRLSALTTKLGVDHDSRF